MGTHRGRGAPGLEGSPGMEAVLGHRGAELRLQDRDHSGTAVPAFVSSPCVLVCLG